MENIAMILALICYYILNTQICVYCVTIGIIKRKVTFFTLCIVPFAAFMYAYHSYIKGNLTTFMTRYKKLK